MKDEYYANNAARLNTIIGDQSVFWQKIKRARREFLAEPANGPADRDFESHAREFITWLDDRYGIRLGQDETGRIKTFYEVTDEQKQLVFEIKFSSD